MSNHHNRTKRETQKGMLLNPLVLQNGLQYYKHDMKEIDGYVQVNEGSWILTKEQAKKSLVMSHLGWDGRVELAVWDVF